jgi:hypothetical protein
MAILLMLGIVLQRWTPELLSVSHFHRTFGFKALLVTCAPYLHGLVVVPPNLLQGLYAQVPGALPGTGDLEGLYVVRKLYI